MKSLTDLIIEQNEDGAVEAWFEIGALAYTDDNYEDELKEAREVWAAVRTDEGLEATTPPTLTRPSANMKLAKGGVPSYGLTLQHYVTRFTNTKLTINACPSAGDCTKMCVLDNGKGSFDMVQKARRARTRFWTYHAADAAMLLGYELAEAVAKEGKILFRPNVNSDVQWERVLPTLTEGNFFGQDVKSYGYSKIPETLDSNGWLGKKYRVAYSFNENSPGEDDIYNFLQAGGAMAVVTNRKPKDPIEQWNDNFKVVDADVTDEWMFDEGVIGDLSAKGKARKYIGTTGFIAEVY